MAASETHLAVKGLPKRRLAEFVRRAKSFGMTPEKYLRTLVEEDLTVSRKARTTTFHELMGSARIVDEQELDQLVEAVKERHHRRSTRKR